MFKPVSKLKRGASSILTNAEMKSRKLKSTLNNKIDTEVARLDSEVKVLKSLSASQRT